MSVNIRVPARAPVFARARGRDRYKRYVWSTNRGRIASPLDTRTASRYFRFDLAMTRRATEEVKRNRPEIFGRIFFRSFPSHVSPHAWIRRFRRLDPFSHAMRARSFTSARVLSIHFPSRRRRFLAFIREPVDNLITAIHRLYK